MSLSTNAKHRSHEGEQRDVEPGHVGMGLEVLPRVDDDQRADGSDEDGEQHTEAIEPERQRQIERWSPTCRDAVRPAAADNEGGVREVACERRGDGGEQQ